MRRYCHIGLILFSLRLWPVLLGFWVTECESSPVFAAPDGFVLFTQAMRAKHRLTYSGRQTVFMSAPDSLGGPVQIVVDVARQGRCCVMTYRYPQTMAGMIQKDDGQQSVQFWPAQKRLVLGPSHAAEEAEAISAPMLALLKRNYRCLLLRRETVNHVLCDVVALQRRDTEGPTRLCWIDPRTKAILRTEEYDSSGSLQYVSAFQTFSYRKALPPKSLRLPAPAAEAKRTPAAQIARTEASYAQAFSDAGVSGRYPLWLPKGYCLLRCRCERPDPHHAIAMLQFGDGLKTISVLEETAGDKTSLHAAEMDLNRVLTSYGQQARIAHDGTLRVTVIGDRTLPPLLCAEILSALRHGGEAKLNRSLLQTFGPTAAQYASVLRHRGWGYDEIAALLLCLQSKPAARFENHDWFVHLTDWPSTAQRLHTDAHRWNPAAHAWMSSVLVH